MWIGVQTALADGVGTGRKGAIAVPVHVFCQRVILIPRQVLVTRWSAARTFVPELRIFLHDAWVDVEANVVLPVHG